MINIFFFFFLLSVFNLSSCYSQKTFTKSNFVPIVRIDSLTFYNGPCFSYCQQGKTTIDRNGRIHYDIDSFSYKGFVDIHQLLFVFTYIEKAGLFKWKCKSPCFICDGNTQNIDYYISGIASTKKDSLFKTSLVACSDTLETFIPISLLFDYLVSNANWQNNNPPLNYDLPRDSLRLRMDIEKTSKKLLQMKTMIKSIFLEDTTGIPNNLQINKPK
jgi:hypothetical protein